MTKQIYAAIYRNLIQDLRDHTKDLKPHQVLSFYESVGTMLSDHGPQIQRERVCGDAIDTYSQSPGRRVFKGQYNSEFLAEVKTAVICVSF